MIIRHAFSGQAAPAFSRTSYSFDAASGVIVGTNWGGTIAWSGGTAPFTVQLLMNGNLQYQVTGVTANAYTLRGPAIQGWNGMSMSLKVIDAMGSSITTPGQVISIYWMGTVSVSVSSTFPPVGQFISMTATVSSGNPASYSYQWQYRSRINSGATWGSWTNFSSSVKTAYSGTFYTSGEQFEFRCTVTNSGGSTIGYSATVTAV